MSDNKPIIIALIVVLTVILGVIAYFVTSTDPEPPAVAEITIPDPAPEPEPEREPAPEPIAGSSAELPGEPEVSQEPAFVLPQLDDSDSLIRDGVVSLTRHEGINTWLAANQLIPKFVALVNSAAQGQVVKGPVRPTHPRRPVPGEANRRCNL